MTATKLFIQNQRLFGRHFDKKDRQSRPLGVSYICITSEKEEIGYGTKLYLLNGTFHRLIQGRFKDGEQLVGYGKMFYDLEKTKYYSGHWMDGQKHGKGLYVVSKNSNYTGDWHWNKMQGRGKFYYPNGCYYEGQFYNNKKDGDGKYVCDGIPVFVGEYKDDKWWEGTRTIRNKNNCKVKYKDGDIDEKDPNSKYCN